MTGLTEAQITAALKSDAFAKVEQTHQVAKRLPLELLDFDELFDDALEAMRKLLDDPATPATTILRIIEEIFDRDPTRAFAKRTQPARPINAPSPVFDNEAIKRVKERAAELAREKARPEP